MSFLRLIYWSCLIGGWSAFIGWLFTEILFHYWIDYTALAILMATLVSVLIGGGISLASGLTNPQFPHLLKRLLLGFAGGLLGGLLGSLLGACIFGVLQGVPVLGFLSRILGWTLIGIGIGVTEGIFDRNMKKIRNGLIGGGIGGFLAGLFFIPVSFVASPMSSRAVGFVLLGLCIGLAIGLAQVILKEAWLTVEDGFRPGRQMILGKDLVTMGTSEKASLIFIAYGAKGVEPIHLKISKQPDGHYLLEDNQSRTGTLLNGKALPAATPIKDGDAIQFGVNVVRFNERVKQGEAKLPPAATEASKPIPMAAIAAPPPIKPAPAAAVPSKPAPPPKPAPAPPPAALVQAQEGRCPICDKKVVGVPGQRRCAKCFTTF
jgi:hypothetical protein